MKSRLPYYCNAEHIVLLRYGFVVLLSLLAFVLLAEDSVLAEQRAEKVRVGTSAKQEIIFKHSIQFPAISLLPAKLQVSLNTKDLSAVRALLQSDTRFFVLPMKKSSVPGEFTVEFPSPDKELRYRFQFQKNDSGVELSPWYFALPHCGAAEIRQAIEQTDPGEAKRSLVREAIVLDREVERLRFALEVLKND